MRPAVIILSLIFLSGARLSGAILINELVTNTGDDWIEIACTGNSEERIDIQGLYVTMYYGANEPLGMEPITLRGSDNPATPYDDRFAVVHLADPATPDETDRTGDTNHNGRIDIYCNNYHASLWNTDGVAAIDTDDDPANGGIIDFIFYSNRDGSPSDVMASYAAAAQAHGHWRGCDAENIQECAVPIGARGLSSHMSLARKSFADTNGAADFAVSSMPTPGAPNMIAPAFMGTRIFKPLRKKITIIPGHRLFGTGAIPLFVFSPCQFRIRVFSSIGMPVHESALFPPAKPGPYNLFWQPLLQRNIPPTGLYLCTIEAVSPALRASQEETIYLILNRYR